MRVLVAGGSRFVCRHIVSRLLRRGHRVTLFNRGRTDPGAFVDQPDVQHVVGDRDGDLGVLRGRRWDAVIDTSAYRSTQVAHLLDALAGRFDRYVLISTVSVYDTPLPAGATEEAPLLAAVHDGEAGEERTGAGSDPATAYGARKAACEAVVRERLDDGALLIVRPGFLIGPGDYTWRFPYWIERMARGGPVLVPAPLDSPLQVLDARDLAVFITRALEVRLAGTLHVAGPADPCTLAEVLDCMESAIRGGGRPIWVDRGWLAERGVAAETLPLIVPADATANLMRLDLGSALAAGLSPRPLGDTIVETLDWMRAGAPRPAAVGLDTAREAGLLTAWRAAVGEPRPGHHRGTSGGRAGGTT